MNRCPTAPVNCVVSSAVLLYSCSKLSGANAALSYVQLLQTEWCQVQCSNTALVHRLSDSNAIRETGSANATLSYSSCKMNDEQTATSYRCCQFKWL